MSNKPNPNMDMSEVMRLANSPAGQQLISMLRSSKSQDLQSAMEKASAGDYRDAQKAIESFLSNPEAKELLKQLGR